MHVRHQLSDLSGTNYPTNDRCGFDPSQPLRLSNNRRDKKAK